MSDTNPKQKTWTDEEFSALIGRAICHPDIWQEAKRARRSEAALKARCAELEKALAWALEKVGKPSHRILRQNEEHFDAYQRACALLSPRDGEAK